MVFKKIVEEKADAWTQVHLLKVNEDEIEEIKLDQLAFISNSIKQWYDKYIIFWKDGYYIDYDIHNFIDIDQNKKTIVKFDYIFKTLYFKEDYHRYIQINRANGENILTDEINKDANEDYHHATLTFLPVFNIKNIHLNFLLDIISKRK